MIGEISRPARSNGWRHRLVGSGFGVALLKLEVSRLPGVNVFPVIERELRAEARNTITYGIRLVGAALLLFASIVFLSNPGSALSGRELFFELHQFLLGTVWLWIPLISADCISREKREETLGLLFLTPLKARDIMAREIVTVGSDMLVEDAAKLLAYHNISGMPVEDPDGKVVGIVSEADVIGHIEAIVSDVMTEDVISAGEDATVEEIATLLAQHRIKRVPVMNNGAIRGMVSRSDIVRAIASRS